MKGEFDFGAAQSAASGKATRELPPQSQPHSRRVQAGMSGRADGERADTHKHFTSTLSSEPHIHHDERRPPPL